MKIFIQDFGIIPIANVIFRCNVVGKATKKRNSELRDTTRKVYPPVIMSVGRDIFFSFWWQKWLPKKHKQKIPPNLIFFFFFQKNVGTLIFFFQQFSAKFLLCCKFVKLYLALSASNAKVE